MAAIYERWLGAPEVQKLILLSIRCILTEKGIEARLMRYVYETTRSVLRPDYPRCPFWPLAGSQVHQHLNSGIFPTPSEVWDALPLLGSEWRAAAPSV